MVAIAMLICCAPPLTRPGTISFATCLISAVILGHGRRKP